MMCRLLKVARSSYYEWVDRIGVITTTAARGAEVTETVKTVFRSSRKPMGAAGSRSY